MSSLVRSGEVNDFVMGLIEGRTDEFSKSCIHDSETLGACFLYEYSTCDECSPLCREGTPKFAVESLTWAQTKVLFEYGKVLLEIRYRVFLRFIVVNAQTTSHVDALSLNASHFKCVLDFIDSVAKDTKTVEVEYLRANVEVEPVIIDVR